MAEQITIIYLITTNILLIIIIVRGKIFIVTS